MLRNLRMMIANPNIRLGLGLTIMGAGIHLLNKASTGYAEQAQGAMEVYDEQAQHLREIDRKVETRQGLLAELADQIATAERILISQERRRDAIPASILETWTPADDAAAAADSNDG